MIECGDHQRTVRMARVGDGTPTVAATIGQRRSFVWPITRVDARAFRDDDPATTASAAFVVRDVSRRECPFIVTKIRDMGPEHDSIRGCATPETERGTKAHRRAETGLRERVTGFE